MHNNNNINSHEVSQLYPSDDGDVQVQHVTVQRTLSGRRSSLSSLPELQAQLFQQNEQQHHRNSYTSTTRRRSSIATTTTMTTTSSVASSSVIGNGSMTEVVQEERRKNIKAIMSDTTLTQKEKSKKIQALMDGRGQQQSNQNQSQHLHLNSQLSGSSIHTTNTNNRRGSMGSYCSNASSVYASSMAQVAADAVCETIHLYSNSNNHYMNGNTDVGADYDRSYHTTQSYSYSSSQTEEDVMASNEVQANVVGTDKLGNYKQYHGRSKSLTDWTDSDRATVAAQTTVFGNKIQQASRLMEQSRPACEHYERNCTIVSPCCGLAFGCRICHDECPVLPPPICFKTLRSSYEAGTPTLRDSDVSSTTAVHDVTTTTCTAGTTTHLPSHHSTNKLERRRSLPSELNTTTLFNIQNDHHLIDRFAIREVICRHCYTRQSSKSNKCISCSIVFGQYHCNICNLWMSDVESPYHCEDCGFCRVGGRDHFRHCNDCGMCIDTLLFEDHNCKSGKYMSNCPICQEDLFSSRFASHEMPCGHAIHWHCFTELTSYDTRCPVCKKTVESPERMEATWNAIAVGIALQPVPPEMARAVNILCNDCETITNNQRWHFLGVRCKNCYSFNTIVEQVVIQGREAASYLDRIESWSMAQQHMGGVPTDISLPTRFIGSNNYQNNMSNDDSSDDTMSEEDGMEE